MADNIFDAQRDRRIQNLQQQSVSNIIKINPNLRTVLSRYEDAEVSRLKLLELQRLKNKKITAGERALLKAVSKGRARRGRGGRSPKKKKQEVEPPVKSQVQIEVEAEEKRRKLAQQDRFLELEDFRQQREFYANERTLQQRELQRQTDFISGQNRIIADINIANYNAAQAALRAQAENDSRTAQAIANRNQQQQLEDRRINLERRQIDNQFQANREQRALEYARIDNDRQRYDRDVQVARAQRDADIRRAQAQLDGVQQRVARDNAERHAERQAQQELALRELAARQQDNELRHRQEQNRIDNQRAVDAERAITDRELIQGFTAAIDALNRQQPPPQTGVVSAQQLAAQVREGLRTAVEPNQLPEVPRTDPRPEVQPAPERAQPEPEPQPVLRPAQQRQFERRGIDDPTQEGVPTPGTLREKPGKKPKRFEGGATEAELRSEIGTASGESSLSTDTGTGLSPHAQRLLSIQQGRGTPTFEVEPRAAPQGVGRGQGARGIRSPSPESPLLRPNPAPESEGSFSSDPSIIGEYSQNTPLDRAGRGRVETLEEEQTLGGQLVGAVGGAAQVTGEVIGGAVAGVAQGIAEQLPTAGQVGAAVGRGGVAAVTGITSAVYEGLRGSPRPGEQSGGRLTPRGRERDPTLETL